LNERGAFVLSTKHLLKTFKIIGGMNMKNKLIDKINASQIEVDNLLALVDIIAAINYYGITELLDTIGEESLKGHLEMDKSYQIDPSI
jgi:hypothetical protein